MSGLYWRFLRRDWRSRELRILALSLAVAVMTVTAITVFSAKLQSLIEQSSSQFIAADRQLVSPYPVEEAWLTEARARGLEVARTLEFASMLFADKGMQLVSVKAVSDRYPLKGEVRVSERPGAAARPVRHGPPSGEIWIAPRLFTLLDLEMGAKVAIGDLDLEVRQVLEREPDTSFNFTSLSPRVLMNWDDVAATGVVQPGSRLTYSYLFAGESGVMQDYENWLKPQLGPSHRWQDVRSGRPTIAKAIDKAERYLLLGGSLAVMLAGIAIAMSARQYARAQYDQVALLKTLGLRGRTINYYYGARLLLLGLVCTLAGMLLGWLGHHLILKALAEVLPPLEAQAPMRSFLVGALTALVVMLACALPPLWRLGQVTPVRVLRRDLQSDAGRLTGWAVVVLAAMLALLWFYSRDLRLTGLVLAGILAVTAVFAGLAALLLRAGRLVGTQAGSYWRLGLASLARRRRESILQVVVFALALMLLLIIFLLRTSLVSQWQAQLPPDAPNHFLINIAPSDVDAIRDYLNEQGIVSTELYPMVRGRLTHINDKPAQQSVSKEAEVNALNRELNLTWMRRLPADNRITDGSWWGEEAGVEPWVSMEAELAGRLGVGVGDRLTFTIGDQAIDVLVKSLRSVQWDSMKPNFYVVFTPGFLERFPATYITSAHIDPGRKALLNDLSRRFPTVTILELDQLIERVRGIMAQVGLAVELVLVLILVAALLVIAALVNLTMAERYRESALLRALGAGRRLIGGGILVEFAAVGALAGLVAVAGAELTVWALQKRAFDIPASLHPELWLLAPVAGALVIGLLGYGQSLRLVRTAPMAALRQAE